MAELRTTPGEQDARAFVAAIPDDGRRRDAGVILDLMVGRPASRR